MARQKIAGSLLLLDDTFKPSLPLLFDFLGVPDSARGAAPTDAATRLALVLAACVALLRARTHRQPAVLLVEDLHWLDGSSDAFLRRLIPALADAPVLPVLNFRPEYDHEWLRDPRYRQIALQPLAEADASALLGELLGHDPSLGELGAHLSTRAAGNPFFVEELVQSLVQSGALAGAKGAYHLACTVDVAAIPTSVQAVLAARIDRLPARDKEVLQTAAVIGKQFASEVLRAVSDLPGTELDGALQALAAAELVVEQTARPVAEYAFKHPLTQEVAYATQLTARRAQLHAAAARALVAAGGQSSERAALIAYHWERAGEVWEAAQWQRRTARALVGTDTREALARLRHVLALLDTLPESPSVVTLLLETDDDLIRMGSLSGMSLEESERLFAMGRALAERTGSPALLLRLLSTFSEFLMMRGQSADAQAHLAEASALAAGIDDNIAQLGVAIDQAQAAFWAGHLREALTHVEAARRRIALGMPATTAIAVALSSEAFVVALHGLCLAMMGRPRDGAAVLDGVVRMADEDRSLEGRCIARQFRSIAALTAGELSLAAAQAQAAMELATQAGNSYLQQMASCQMGYAYVYVGRHAEAIQLLEPCADEGAASSALGMLRWYMLSALAEAHRREGELETARAIATRAVELGHANGALTAEYNAQLVLASTLAAMHGEAAGPAIDAALARADSLLAESGAESFRPRWHLTRAECARAEGKVETVRRELQAAQGVCERLGMDEFAGEIARELASAGGAGTPRRLPGPGRSPDHHA